MAARKILIRAGLSPLDHSSVSDIIRNNMIGGNVGNLVYAYSLFRMLMTDPETVLVPDYYKAESGLFTDRYADRISEEYEMYLIPLPDAFRSDFVQGLENLTKFVRRLKIPAVIIGCGIKAKLTQDISRGYAFDDTVLAFLKAVLEHSPMIGLRGERTMEYVQHLGLIPEKDATVIGCPSMYAFGPELAIREPCVQPDSKIIVTNNPYAPSKVHRFLRRVMEEYPQAFFIPQRQEELQEMYLGTPLSATALSKAAAKAPDYPRTIHDEVFSSGRSAFYLDYRSWRNAVSDADLCIGPRLHGNITCLLSGVPSLLIAKDMRTQEAADYHRFSYILQDEITDETALPSLLNRIDVKKTCEAQRENFLHYTRFLSECGIRHIYEDPDHPKESVLDKKLEGRKYRPPVRPASSVPPVVRLLRHRAEWWKVYNLLPEGIRQSVRQKLGRKV